MMICRLQQARDGTVLLITLMLTMGLTVVLSTYLVLVANQARWSVDRSSQVQAFYLAEAGLNRAVWHLIHTAPDGSADGSWRTSAFPAPSGPGGNDPRQETLAEGSFTLWVESAGGGSILITARGEYGGLQETVQQEVTVTPGSPNFVAPVGQTWHQI